MKSAPEYVESLWGDPSAKSVQLLAKELCKSPQLLSQTLTKLLAKGKNFEDLVQVLRSAPSPNYPVEDLAAQPCPICGESRVSVCRYPLYLSQFFSGRLLLICNSCGLGWEPTKDLDLEHYYEAHYSNEFRRQRAFKGRFHSKANPFWANPKNRILVRAQHHVELLEPYLPAGRVLDIGAGEGVFLSLVDARRKFAIEHDLHGRRILKDELGIELLADPQSARDMDLIVASHVVEHFTAAGVIEKLEELRQGLSEGGTLLVEVPPGAWQLEEFSLGNRPPGQRMEPHTLFFSTVSLEVLLTRAGFQISMISLCPWTKKHQPNFAEALRSRGVRVVQRGPLVALVGRKKE